MPEVEATVFVHSAFDLVSAPWWFFSSTVVEQTGSDFFSLSSSEDEASSSSSRLPVAYLVSESNRICVLKGISDLLRPSLLYRLEFRFNIS